MSERPELGAVVRIDGGLYECVGIGDGTTVYFERVGSKWMPDMRSAGPAALLAQRPELQAGGTARGHGDDMRAEEIVADRCPHCMEGVVQMVHVDLFPGPRYLTNGLCPFCDGIGTAWFPCEWCGWWRNTTDPCLGCGK